MRGWVYGRMQREDATRGCNEKMHWADVFIVRWVGFRGCIRRRVVLHDIPVHLVRYWRLPGLIYDPLRSSRNAQRHSRVDACLMGGGQVG